MLNITIISVNVRSNFSLDLAFYLLVFWVGKLGLNLRGYQKFFVEVMRLLNEKKPHTRK